MKVKITHVSNDWAPVKKGLEGGYNKVVVTQALENIMFNNHKIYTGKTLKLNLNSDQPNKNEWLQYLTEGNVLDVQLRQTGRVIHVDKYKSPQLIKEAKGTPVEDL